VRSEGFYVNGKSTNTTWNWTNNLSICSTAPYTLCYRGPLIEISTRNISREKGISGRCIGLTTLLPSCADFLDILQPQLPGTLRACPGLYRDSFTFYIYIYVYIYIYIYNKVVRVITVVLHSSQLMHGHEQHVLFSFGLERGRLVSLTKSELYYKIDKHFRPRSNSFFYLYIIFVLQNVVCGGCKLKMLNPSLACVLFTYAPLH